MSTTLRKTFIFLFFLVNTALSYGQGWLQTNGPAGGNVLEMLEKNGAIIATTYGGIYRTVDNGETWVHSNTGLGIDEPEYLAQTPNYIYATSFTSDHLYKSGDAGITWSDVPINVGPLFVLDLFASHDTLYLGLYGGGVVRSTNDGATFEFINTGFPASAYVVTFAQVGQYLFCGLSGNGGTVGIYRTPVNAINWVQMNNGLTAPLTFPSVIDIQTKGTDLYIVAGSAFAAGVFKSTNLGNDWFEPLPGFNDFGGSLAVYHGDLYTAVDGGSIFRSTDNGLSWAPRSNGLKALSGFCWLPGSNGLFIGTERGVARTTNDGTNWEVKSRGITNTWVTSFFPDGDTLFATTKNNVPGRSEGVYYTTDAGQNWPYLNNGLFPNPEGNAIIKSGGNIILGTDGTGIYVKRPTDLAFIRHADVPDFALVNALISSGNVVLAGVAGLGELYRSTDYGLTWTQSNTGFDDAQEDQVYCFHEYNGAIYAGAFNALYKSTDLGLTWTNSYTGIYPGADIRGITNQGNDLYAADHQTGMYKSTNNGASWFTVNNGLTSTPNKIISYNGILYAGTDGGVFRSVNNGGTWTEYNDGLLLEKVISSMAIYKNQLVLGTKETAAWFNLSVVPVQLLSFTAAAVNNDYIKLTWTTAQENNIQNYIIERAAEGSNNFETIGTIVPAGSQSQRSYNFIDRDVKANVLYRYRLRVMELSGDKYSEIKTAKIAGENINVNVSPNPATGGYVKVVVSGYKGNGTISLSNSTGQKIYYSTTLFQEQTIISIYVEDQPKGIYLMQLKVNGQIITKKVFIN